VPVETPPIARVTEISTVPRRQRGGLKEDVGAPYEYNIIMFVFTLRPTAAMCIVSVFKL